MNLRKLAVCVLVIISFSCLKSRDGKHEDIVVLEFNPEWYWIYKNVKPTKLSESDFSIIETVLEQAVRNYNSNLAEAIEERKKWFEKTYPNRDFEKSEPKLTLDLKDYKRQYVPVLNEKGEKEVWVNLFCTTEYTNWREEIVIYHDGGNCFFNLKINLDNQSYSEFQVNGIA